MIKFYLFQLNQKIYALTSFVPKVFIIAYYLMLVVKKYKITFTKSNYSIHNIYQFVIQELEDNKLMKEIMTPTNELFKVKWNIGFAIFIYLLITIF